MSMRNYKFLVLVITVALASVAALWLLPTWRAALAQRWLSWDGWWKDYAAFFAVVLTVTLVSVVGLWRILSRHLQPEGFQQKKDFILTIAQILGGVTLILSLFSAWQSIYKTQHDLKAARDQMALNQQTSERNLEVSLATLEDARQRQLAERYAKAVEQLGNKEMGVRIGAIFALERIAAEDAEYQARKKLPGEDSQYHWQVMQILTAYVREKASWGGGRNARPAKLMPPDIEAVMNVVARRKLTYMNGEGDKDRRLNLRGTDLRGLVLKGGANFAGIDFEEARLDEANLRGAILDHAMLRNARLDNAYLTEASFKGTELDGACVSGAELPPAANLDWDTLAVAHGVDKAQLPPALREQMLADPDGMPPCEDK